MRAISLMLGVILNALSIVLGSFVGILFKHSISEAVRNTLRISMSFIIIAVGIKMALKFETILLLVFCVVFGGLIGTALQLEKKLDRFGEFIKERFSRSTDSQFPLAFSMSTILYCVGALAVVGSIQSGVSGNHEILFMKSFLDGITSVTLAALYGIGVAFSAVPVFLYQGLIALMAPKIQYLTNPKVIADISGVGGVLVMMIGFNISGMCKIDVGNYFPAIVLAIACAPFIL